MLAAKREPCSQTVFYGTALVAVCVALHLSRQIMGIEPTGRQKCSNNHFVARWYCFFLSFSFAESDFLSKKLCLTAHTNKKSTYLQCNNFIFLVPLKFLPNCSKLLDLHSLKQLKIKCSFTGKRYKELNENELLYTHLYLTCLTLTNKSKWNRFFFLTVLTRDPYCSYRGLYWSCWLAASS